MLWSKLKSLVSWQLRWGHKYCQLKQLNKKLFICQSTSRWRYIIRSEHWSFFVGKYLVDEGIVNWSNWTNNYFCVNQLVAKFTPFHLVNDHFVASNWLLMYLLFTDAFEGTTIKKRCFFSNFLPSSFLTAFIVLCKALLEEIQLPVVTPESNTKIDSETLDGIFPFPNSKKGEKRTGKGCKFWHKTRMMPKLGRCGPFEGYIFSVDKLSITT